MQKSFVERIFPHPQHAGDERPRPLSSPAASFATSPRDSSRSTRPLQSSPLASQGLNAPPLSSSVHHADPLLPIERAARSLEITIQSFLDAQSDGLLAGLGVGPQDDFSSGSLTPTQSISTPSQKSVGPKVMPIRQPKTQKITLHGARRGLIKSMREFALLKDEELKVLDDQHIHREDALRKASAYENKRSALRAELSAAREDENMSAARDIRIEAQNLEREIRELEDRLMDMKGRHRNMLNQADQLENSVDSKLSSYKSSIAMVDMEIRKFLRRPPIQQSLPEDVTGMAHGGMYALKPERRTLEMAKEQWKSEQEALARRRTDVENERQALQAGAKMWSDASKRIAAFEKTLAEETKCLANSQGGLDSDSSAKVLLSHLSTLITSLNADLAAAESHKWNLLICTLSAEIEALREGRSILQETLGIEPSSHSDDSPNDPESDANDDDDDAGLDEELVGYGADASGGVLHSPGTNSNKSLEETMKEFDKPQDAFQAEEPPTKRDPPKSSSSSSSSFNSRQTSMLHARSDSTRSIAAGFGPSMDTRSESEDDNDDPGPDFLLSH